MGSTFKAWALILLIVGIIASIVLGVAFQTEYKEYEWSAKTEKVFNTPICLAVCGASLAVFLALHATGCILCNQEEQIELLKKLLDKK